MMKIADMHSRRLMIGGGLVVVAIMAAGAPVRTVETEIAAQSVAAVLEPSVRLVAGEADEARTALIQAAVDSLAPRVTRKSHADALRIAFTAYYNFKAEHPDAVRKPYLYFVDYGLDNGTPRGYVFDMETLTLVEGPFIVAHGRGSAASRNGVPMRFSNRAGSAATSLGLYLAEETYGFSGKAGGRFYTSIGLRLDGMSGTFNNRARARGVVVHGAPYVTARAAGRSEGCPAMEQSRARRLIPLIANGGIVFQYSPNNPQWLSQDPWVNAATSEPASPEHAGVSTRT